MLCGALRIAARILLVLATQDGTNNGTVTQDQVAPYGEGDQDNDRSNDIADTAAGSGSF